MDDNDALRLAALLCSRLAHDLAGPASAISNGLELAVDGAGNDAVDLTRDASRQLKNRLAFFRRAYGTGEGMTWDEARRISEDYLAGTRHRVTWSETPAGVSPLARLLLNMILCAMETTPGGGTLEVMPSAEPAVSALGDLAELALPKGGNLYQDMSPRQVQPVFTAHLAWALGLDLDTEVVAARHIIWHVKIINSL
jgi:histidine phosphotransferase ChpT